MIQCQSLLSSVGSKHEVSLHGKTNSITHIPISLNPPPWTHLHVWKGACKQLFSWEKSPKSALVLSLQLLVLVAKGSSSAHPVCSMPFHSLIMKNSPCIAVAHVFSPMCKGEIFRLHKHHWSLGNHCSALHIYHALMEPQDKHGL